MRKKPNKTNNPVIGRYLISVQCKNAFGYSLVAWSNIFPKEVLYLHS